MDVSVIIVNYNTKKLLADCLTSVYRQTSGLDLEVIVVDNASKDGSQEMIQNDFPQVQLIESDENLGFGRANNRGAEIAKGKYLFLLNSDTVVKNNAVKMFFDFTEKNKEDNIGVVGTILSDEQLNRVHSFDFLPSICRDLWSDIKINIVNILGKTRPYGKMKNVLKGKAEQKTTKNNLQQSFFEVEYITGAALFMRKDVFELCEGFDPNYFMYYEESDLQYRMKQEGLKSVIITQPCIIHYEGASFKSNNIKKSNTKRYYLEKSRFYYYKKNKSIFEYVLYRTLFSLVQLMTLFDCSYTIKDRINYLLYLIRLKIVSV